MTPDLAPRRTVGAVVGDVVSDLQAKALRRRSAETATLARLRRAVGKPPGQDLTLLAYTHVDEFARGDEPTREEIAVHTALTLFAVHQQSRSDAMHRRGRGLGGALRSLSTESQPPPPLAHRFAVLGTSQGLPELAHHLRGAVQLLRQAGTPLDYGLLADELLSWQFPPDGPARVRLRWGRDFHRTRNIAPDPDLDNPAAPDDTEGNAP